MYKLLHERDVWLNFSIYLSQKFALNLKIQCEIIINKKRKILENRIQERKDIIKVHA